MTAKELYDRDFLEWTRCNAALLRAGRFREADIEHIAEELDDMGRSEQRELESRLQILLKHLLKWQVQPERRGRSWEATIRVQRLEIDRLQRRMPSLRNLLAEGIGEVYPAAVIKASLETRLPESSFPKTCPFTVEQILDEGYFPG
jgi:hypothetical protein